MSEMQRIWSEPEFLSSRPELRGKCGEYLEVTELIMLSLFLGFLLTSKVNLSNSFSSINLLTVYMISYADCPVS
jgi:hypothetical protein